MIISAEFCAFVRHRLNPPTYTQSHTTPPPPTPQPPPDLKDRGLILFTFHLNCKYHPWGLINDMQMSIITGNTGMLFPIHFTLSDKKGDWPPSRPPQRVSRVPDYLLLNSVCLELVPGQIDS